MQLKHVENQAQFINTKSKIKEIVGHAIGALKNGKIPLKDLEYSVEIHEDPKNKIYTKTLHQPYQAAIQLINLGKAVKRWDVMRFIKVKPFNYGGKRFTVKPATLVKNVREVNVEDYVRNLTTALNQTFKPMNIMFSSKRTTERTLFDFSKK